MSLFMFSCGLDAKTMPSSTGATVTRVNAASNSRGLGSKEVSNEMSKVHTFPFTFSHHRINNRQEEMVSKTKTFFTYLFSLGKVKHHKSRQL